MQSQLSVIFCALIYPGLDGVDLFSAQRTHLAAGNRLVVMRWHLNFGVGLMVDQAVQGTGQAVTRHNHLTEFRTFHQGIV